MNVDGLRGLFFLDTNIFVYSFDVTTPIKQKIAQNLIYAALHTQRGVISSQIIQEFLNLALRKFAHPLSSTESKEYLQGILLPLCQHFPTVSFYDRALSVRDETGYSFYDALVVAAAADIGCSILLSEDLQNGRKVQGVTIMNPFISA